MRSLKAGVLIATVAALLTPATAWAHDVEVVVRLDTPGVADATAKSRVLSAPVRARRLDLTSPTTSSYLGAVARSEAAFETRLARAIPSARVYRRYRIVLNGLALTLPAEDVQKLRRLADIYPSVTYTSRLDRSVPLIDAPLYWSFPGVGAGAGAKVAILDDGIDQSHPFLSPTGLAMPPGFPKGQTSHTTAKVIVARAFPPRGLTWPNGRVPFDPELSSHATHVAGIAAGNAGTIGPGGVRLSGVAPGAYLGNYKVLTVPTENFGLNGNAPEIVAGIEAAVADGMDVINLSLGQFELEPTRDVVALAIDGAATAGVPTVAAAGNEFSSFGSGSVTSPGTAGSAIAVASIAEGGTGLSVSSFSSGGPAAVSLRLKPDVAAPGSSILSSSPGADWSQLSGTSMASPHVAGAIALLRRRHPNWTAAQFRSALVTTARPVGTAGPLRVGGGLINVPDADTPLVFTAPSAVSFGLLRPGRARVVTVRLTDAGGGAGLWQVTGHQGFPSTVTVPGELRLRIVAGAQTGDEEGYVVLSRGDIRRRIPFWVGVASPRLSRPSRVLSRAGTYRGSTVGGPRRVERYRFPSVGPPQAGPERVFRVRIRRRVANFGVAVLAGAVQPRIVHAGNESRVLGVPALPINSNPYLRGYGTPRSIAGAIRPALGAYDIVIDSRARGDRFTFRFWVDDVRPPTARLATRAASGGAIRLRVADAGAGVDPRSAQATVDGRARPVRVSGGVAVVDVQGVQPGSRELVFRISDYQESKNNENVAGVLPNTRTIRATIRVP